MLDSVLTLHPHLYCTVLYTVFTTSFVEMFHFDPAPDSQVAGSGSNSSSSSSSTKYPNFSGTFNSQKVTSAFLCSSSTSLNLKGQINVLHDCSFLYFFFFKY